MKKLADRYRLTVDSHLSHSWSSALPAVDFVVATDTQARPITCITLAVVDQAELIGLLVNIHAQGLTLLSLNRVELPNTHMQGSERV
jgi:hypothetical protein